MQKLSHLEVSQEAHDTIELKTRQCQAAKSRSKVRAGKKLSDRCWADTEGRRYCNTARWGTNKYCVNTVKYCEILCEYCEILQRYRREILQDTAQILHKYCEQVVWYCVDIVGNVWNNVLHKRIVDQEGVPYKGITRQRYYGQRYYSDKGITRQRYCSELNPTNTWKISILEIL